MTKSRREIVAEVLMKNGHIKVYADAMAGYILEALDKAEKPVSICDAYTNSCKSTHPRQECSMWIYKSNPPPEKIGELAAIVKDSGIKCKVRKMTNDEIDTSDGAWYACEETGNIYKEDELEFNPTPPERIEEIRPLTLEEAHSIIEVADRINKVIRELNRIKESGR
jgi:hypothetical protein